MTHPYRVEPAVEEARTSSRVSVDAASVAFGFCCVVLGEALAGPSVALLATVVGVALLLARRGVDAARC